MYHFCNVAHVLGDLIENLLMLVEVFKKFTESVEFSTIRRPFSAKISQKSVEYRDSSNLQKYNHTSSQILEMPADVLTILHKLS